MILILLCAISSRTVQTNKAKLHLRLDTFQFHFYRDFVYVALELNGIGHLEVDKVPNRLVCTETYFNIYASVTII